MQFFIRHAILLTILSTIFFLILLPTDFVSAGIDGSPYCCYGCLGCCMGQPCCFQYQDQNGQTVKVETKEDAERLIKEFDTMDVDPEFKKQIIQNLKEFTTKKNIIRKCRSFLNNLKNNLLKKANKNHENKGKKS